MADIQDTLTSLQNQAFAQTVTKPALANSMSNGMQTSVTKIGLGVVTAIALQGAFMNNAFASKSDALKIAAGLSAIVGVANHNKNELRLPGACNVAGINGWRVGGQTFTGAAIFNQFGKGNGNAVMTALGGLLGASTALDSEDQRVTRELYQCATVLHSMNAQQMRAAYVNPNAVPSFLTTADTPSGIVFYTYLDKQNVQRFMTLENSPGVKSLNGEMQGAPLPNNPDLVGVLNKAIEGWVNSYENLKQASNQFGYIVKNSQAQNSSFANNRQQLQQASYNFEKAQVSFAQERAFAVAVFDNAAIANFDLSQYKDLMPLLKLPKEASDACDCKLDNKHSTVPKLLTKNL